MKSLGESSGPHLPRCAENAGSSQSPILRPLKAGGAQIFGGLLNAPRSKLTCPAHTAVLVSTKQHEPSLTSRCHPEQQP